MKQKFNMMLQLRSVAFLGVFIVLGITQWQKLYPLSPYSWYLWCGFGISNFILILSRNKISERFFERAVFFLVLIDLLYLTLLLLWNGGSHNPFAILFIAITSTAALILNRRFLVLTILFALLCLWQVYRTPNASSPSHAMHEMHEMHDDSLSPSNHDFEFHLRGMWLANSIAVMVVSVWIYRLRRENEKISERHQASERILAQIERIDSMGRMLASTAHQLNTPLGTLQLGVSELADEKKPLSETERKQWLVDLQKALTQITHLFSTLHHPENNFFRTESNLDFSEYVETIAKRWAFTRGAEIRFQSELSFKSPEPLLREMGAVLEAIFENAYDAKKKENLLVIQIYLFQEKESIGLSVQDNGVGMNSEIVKHSVEPLFTTKKSGTGLGLYLAHRFALKLKGELKISSTLGKGTTLSFSFRKDLLS